MQLTVRKPSETDMIEHETILNRCRICSEILIALFCAQERIKRAGLLRVVIPGRVRVPIRLPPPVRCLRCRLQLDGKDKVSEALGEVVLQLPPGWRAQAGGSA